MRLTAPTLGWFAMAAAVAGLVVAAFGDKADSVTGIVLGVVVAAFALAVGGIALRTAVRTDAGVPHSLFGLVFAFVALFIALFLLGVQRGGRYSGAPEDPVTTPVPAASAAA